MSEETPGRPSELSRVTRSKQEAQAAYNRISRYYDLLEGIWEKKPRTMGLGKLQVKEGETVLEIGFGTGHGILVLAKSVGESGMVYGIDLSPRMLEITQSRVDKNNLSDRVALMCADAVQLPFAAGLFDAIFMSFTLELFDTPEIPSVLSECKRVLHMGGRICVVSLSKKGEPNWIRNLYEWGHIKFPKLLDCRPIFVQNALEASGFRILDTTTSSLWGLPVEVALATK